MSEYRSASGSSAEDLFIELFADTFGAEKAGYLYSQYHFYDIYQNDRFADFFLESGNRKIAIEIDDEASHNPSVVSRNKLYDDLLKQNSMVYLGWDVFRWAVKQMQIQPDTVKDELRVFVGSDTAFREVEDYLPMQRGKELQGFDLELKEHQKQALKSLEEMRADHETIALLYHATGTGKTVTAVTDAKKCDERNCFLLQWAKLQAENAPLRVMENGEIVGKPMDFADELIFNTIGDKEVTVGQICFQCSDNLGGVILCVAWCEFDDNLNATDWHNF